jgi:hypothetical protein
MAWKAEEWRGKISAVQFVSALTADERLEGITVFQKYDEPIAYCAVCGNGLYHHWLFSCADGTPLIVGDECARIVLGQDPRAYLKDERERQAADAAFARAKAQVAEEARWWKSSEVRELRKTIVLATRMERRLVREFRQGEYRIFRETQTDFIGDSRFHCCMLNYWKRALDAGRKARISEKWQEFIRKSSGDPVGTVNRTFQTARMLCDLRDCRLSLYDSPIVGDFWDRMFPAHGDFAFGSPVSEKQAALIAKLHKRYQKQIKGTSGKVSTNK